MAGAVHAQARQSWHATAVVTCSSANGDPRLPKASVFVHVQTKNVVLV